MKLAVGYVRVSTQEQVDSGAGLAVQRSAILAAADQRDLILTTIHADEGVSGKSVKKRPGLQTAINQLRDGRADILIVSKLDRLSRSVFDFAALMEQASREGWQIVVLDIGVDTATPNGRLITTVMSAFAQWERELIGQRTKEALAEKAAQGVKLGRPRSTDPATVRRIEVMRAGGNTLQAISDALNASQVPLARGGKQWHPATVRSVLAQISAKATLTE